MHGAAAVEAGRADQDVAETVVVEVAGRAHRRTRVGSCRTRPVKMAPGTDGGAVVPLPTRAQVDEPNAVGRCCQAGEAPSRRKRDTRRRRRSGLRGTDQEVVDVAPEAPLTLPASATEKPAWSPEVAPAKITLGTAGLARPS